MRHRVHTLLPYVSKNDDKITLAQQETAYREVQRLQAELGAAIRDRDSVALSIADSDSFIVSLRSKIEALQDSSKVAEYIGEVQFQTCPACYSPIDEGSTAHACHLCKTPFDSEQTHSRITALILDAGLQIKQSEQLQARRRERSISFDSHIKKLTADWQKASARLSTLQTLPSTADRELFRELHRRSGYIDRQIEDLEQKSKLAETIQQLSERKDVLNAEISRLKTTNEALRTQQNKRLSVAVTRISDEIIELLRQDLRRQDIFEDPKSVNFTFGDNKISVDDENYFSASSRAILKSSFFLGFLAAATKTDFFRHPRFCMIDTLENMGVEAIRSNNFQLQILRVSKESKVEHQIIFATAMIEPQLEDDVHCWSILHQRRNEHCN